MMSPYFMLVLLCGITVFHNAGGSVALPRSSFSASHHDAHNITGAALSYEWRNDLYNKNMHQQNPVRTSYFRFQKDVKRRKKSLVQDSLNRDFYKSMRHKRNREELEKGTNVSTDIGNKFESQSAEQNAPVPVIAIANKISNTLQQLAYEELGISELQSLLIKNIDSGKPVQSSASEQLQILYESLRNRLQAYSSLITNMSSAASNRSSPLPSLLYHSYNPCCLLPPHILMYDSRYGCGVNTDLWCDSGFGRGDNPVVMANYKPPPSALTHSFISNAANYPELMWQYYMSRDGLHTEFPAHRTGSGVDDIGIPRCDSYSRHQRVYHSTLRPQGRNIVFLVDTGRGTLPRTLNTFVAIGNFIISGLTEDDTMSVISVNSRVSVGGSSLCSGSALPGTQHNVGEMRSFLQQLTVNRVSQTNHTAGLLTALSIVSTMIDSKAGGGSPVLLIYCSVGAVDALVTSAHVLSAVHNSMKNIHKDSIRFAVLAGDNRHLRANEYRTRQMFLRCLSTLLDPTASNYADYVSCPNDGVSKGEAGRSAIPASQHSNQLHHSLRHTQADVRGILLDINTTDITPPIYRLFDLLGDPPLPPTSSPPKTGGGVTFLAYPWENLKVMFSKPYWDADGEVVVVSVSRGVPCRDTLCAVVGVDIALSSILQDVVHQFFANLPYTAVIIDREGIVVYHPIFGLPSKWTAPVEPVLLGSLETAVSTELLKSIILQHKGYSKPNTKNPSHQQSEVWWQHIGAELGGWILVLLRQVPRHSSPTFEAPSSIVDDSEVADDVTVFALPPHAIYHRLDLLPPERARVCRQFTQMATLDAPTVYLSSRAFTVSGRAALYTPAASTAEEELRIALIMRYLMAGNTNIDDGTFDVDDQGEMSEPDERPHFYSEAAATYVVDGEDAGGGGIVSEYGEYERTTLEDKMKLTLGSNTKDVNPGLNEWVKADVSALYSVAENWRSSYDKNMSDLTQYIIRRFGVLSSGGVVEYPGLLYSADAENTRFDWWLQQTTTQAHSPIGSSARHNHKVSLLPPKLDEAGAGYVVTAAVKTNPLAGDSRGAILAADLSLGYWQKLLLSLHPACDTTGLNMTVSGIGVRCFIVDDTGYLVLHPAGVQPSAIEPYAVNHLHLTTQEPVLAMTLLDTGALESHEGGQPKSKVSRGRGGVLKKGVCGQWWRGTTERRYTLTLAPGQVLSSGQDSAAGKWCVTYSLAAVPNSNLYFGVINQTCATATAFCPCSLVDKLCLYCEFVESKACECPCECPTPKDPVCLTNSSAAHHIKEAAQLKSSLAPVDASLPLCSPEPHQPTHSTSRHQVGLLNELRLCRPLLCSSYSSRLTCMGVAGCEWCMLEPSSDNNTAAHVTTSRPSSSARMRATSRRSASEDDAVWSILTEAQCVPHHLCPGGVRGGVSLYSRGLAPQPHHEESYHHLSRAQPMPVVPVIGIIVGVVVIAGVAAVYCYHQNQGGMMGTLTVTSRPVSAGGYTSTTLVSSNVTHMTTALEEELVVDCDLGAAAAAISPYRINPAYRRPPVPGGDPSDPGYSTMTPHDEPHHPSSASSSSHGLSLPLSSSNQYSSVSPYHLSPHSAKGSSSKKKSMQQLLKKSAGKSGSSSRQGLSSQTEELTEEDVTGDEDRESSSTSGVFKGLAASSLLSGDHEPPHFDWSPEDVQQYFGDLDAAAAANSGCVGANERQRVRKHRGGGGSGGSDAEYETREQLVWVCPQCGYSNSVNTPDFHRGETPEEEEDTEAAQVCEHCGLIVETCEQCRKVTCQCNDSRRGGRGSGGSNSTKTRRRRDTGGSTSDCIESDTNSEAAIDGGPATATSYPASGVSYTQSVLSSPKKIGPNRVIVPVTVHMVDSL